jgi:HEAT repeat protein
LADGPEIAADSISRRRLDEALTSAPKATLEVLTEAVARLGQSFVPTIFETLLADRLSGERSVAGISPMLAEQERQALFDALKRMPVASRACLQQQCESNPPLEVRVKAIEVLGRIGDAMDLRLLLDFVRPKVSVAAPQASSEALIDELSFDLAFVLRDSLERILDRDARGYVQLEAQFAKVPASLRPLLVQAISSRESLAGLSVLARLLGDHAELDASLLTGISRCSSRLAPPFDSAVNDAVRRTLDASSPELLRDAAMASGRLEDSEAIPHLIGLLSHQDRDVRESAHWALCKISGLSFAADAKAWTPWLQAEQSWWQESAADLLSELESADRARALALVQQLARRRYPRHQLAAELTRGLAHPDATVRCLTCVALGQMQSRSAVAALLLRLEDSEDAVREQAHRALRAITGADLPAGRAAWAQAGY